MRSELLKRTALRYLPILLSLVTTRGAISGDILGAAPDSVRITYVGNEGFLIEASGHKVLIDALYRTGVAGYVVHPPELRRMLEKALPPFDGVELVLATHSHADHFDPRTVGTYLVNNRSAHFISTGQAVAQLEELFPAWRHIAERVEAARPAEGERTVVDLDGIEVTALNLHHGRDRPVENLGFLIRIGDWSCLHVGDTEVTPDELKRLKLAEDDLDVVFVPYWFLAYSEWDGQLEAAVGTPTLIAMHIPPKDDPKGYLDDLGGFVGMATRIGDKYPGAVVFENALESTVLP